MNKPVIWTDEFWEGKDELLRLAACAVRVNQNVNAMRHRFLVFDRVKATLKERVTGRNGTDPNFDLVFTQAMIRCRYFGPGYWMKKSEEDGTWGKLDLDRVITVMDVMIE
jgi:hypothetical protein